MIAAGVGTAGSARPALHCDCREARSARPPEEATLTAPDLERADLEDLDLARRAVDVMADRQASDVVLLDLTSLSAFTDYFVIATVDNVRQMRAVLDAVGESFRPARENVPREEGAVESGWVLVDLGGVVVHVFSLERRAYYILEGLWSAGREVVRIQ